MELRLGHNSPVAIQVSDDNRVSLEKEAVSYRHNARIPGWDMELWLTIYYQHLVVGSFPEM